MSYITPDSLEKYFYDKHLSPSHFWILEGVKLEFSDVLSPSEVLRLGQKGNTIALDKFHNMLPEGVAFVEYKLHFKVHPDGYLNDFNTDMGLFPLRCFAYGTLVVPKPKDMIPKPASK